MNKTHLEKFTLQTIADAVRGSDTQAARSVLSSMIGAAVLDVSGKVQKFVKRDGQCKLVIGSADGGLLVFADCQTDAETVRNRKIRKGSRVSVRGKLASFGALAVCLTDCRLQTQNNL